MRATVAGIAAILNADAGGYSNCEEKDAGTVVTTGTAMLLAGKRDCGSGSVTAAGVVVLLVGVALLGVGAIGVYVRVTGAIRFAEQVSLTVAERLVTGVVKPCNALPPEGTGCSIDSAGQSVTITVDRFGVTASAAAGVKP